MAMSSASKDIAISIMPGSFDAQDIIDIHDDPFDALAQIQQAWRQREPPKSWSANNQPGTDVAGVKWHVHEAPAALSNTPGVTDDLLLGIIQTSIDNIQALADEENRRMEQLEATRRDQNEPDNVRKPLGTDENPYLPIIIVDEPASKRTETNTGEQLEQVLLDSDSGVFMTDGVTVSTDANTNKVSAPAHRAEAVRAVRQQLDKAKSLGLRKRLFNRNDDKTSKTDGTPESSGFHLWRRRLQAKSALELFGKTGAGTDSHENLVECVSCLDEFPPKQLIKVPCHSYCRDCFASLISTAVQNEQQWPPKCCLNEIPFRTILKYAPKNLQKEFKDRASEWNIPAGQRLYCSHADCGLWIRPEHINPALRLARCTSGHWSCTLCHGAEHGNDDCPQDRDLTLTNQLAEEEGWKRCFICHALVEHKDACQHMTCRCGAEFCYVCGQQWRTCACTMEQLEAVKSAAQTRRAEREAKEQAESLELQQMLAEIEKFEREEALKAEVLRQEQIRQEEERQQRELERRVRLESARRQEVERKCTELRTTLGQLHDLQRVVIRAEQEKASETLGDESHAAKEQLQIKQREDMEKLTISIQTKIQEKESAFNQDFAERAAAEKKILDGYHCKLIAYYHNRPHGIEGIAKAMLPLQQKMEHLYRGWQEWKRQEMAAYRDMLEEERTIQNELAQSTAERLEEKHKTMEANLVEKNAAERHWFWLVVLEREKLLDELEMQEMEGDADSIFAAEGTLSGEGEERTRSASRVSYPPSSSSSSHRASSSEYMSANGVDKSEAVSEEILLTEYPWAWAFETASFKEESNSVLDTTNSDRVHKPRKGPFKWRGAVTVVGESSGSNAAVTGSASSSNAVTVGVAY